MGSANGACSGFTGETTGGASLPEFVGKVERTLAGLDVASDPRDMNLPGYRLHQPSGNQAGFWAVTVSDNWRLVFRFESGNAYDVDLADYHQEANNMPMKNPPHPGLSILHDCLEPMDMTISEAARRLGVSRKQLSKIVNGRAGISADMAIRLDKVFGGGASTWFQMQAAFDLAQVQESANLPAGERQPVRKASSRKPLGQWLVDNMPRGTNLEPPVRDD